MKRPTRHEFATKTHKVHLVSKAEEVVKPTEELEQSVAEDLLQEDKDIDLDDHLVDHLENLEDVPEVE